MGLENLQSIFGEGAGNNNSQIGGRHGGTNGNQPPHSDEHSTLDNIVGNPLTQEKVGTNISIMEQNPLSSFSTPNVSIPNLPTFGSSLLKLYNSKYDLSEGVSLPPTTSQGTSLTNLNINPPFGANNGMGSNVNIQTTNPGQNNTQDPGIISGVTVTDGLGASEQLTTDGIALTLTGTPNTDFNNGQD